MFNNNAYDFLLAGTQFSKAPKTAQGTNVLTLHELINWGPGLPYQAAGKSQSFTGVVGDNLKKNGIGMIGSLILLNAGVRFAKKQLRPLLRQGNQLLDMGGLRGTVSL